MKLTPRLALAFIIYAGTLFVVLGLLAYNSGRESLRSATISELEATALEKEAALNQWIEDKEADIATLAADPVIVQAASIMLMESDNSPEFREAHDLLTASINPRLLSGEFLEVSLIHPQTGQVIASTNPIEEGKFKEDRPYFLEGRSGPYVQNLYYSIGPQSIAQTAAAPLLAPGGELVGVLAARLDLEDMNEIISRRTGLRATDEAYLVNTSSLFATQPRSLSDPAVLRRGVHTQDIRQCLQQESGVLETVDYRGEPAIVVYRWLPARDMCLVVKLDQTEAYQPIRSFGRTIAGGSLLALLAAAVLGFGLSRTLTRPILDLQTGAARFAQGDLNVRLDDSSPDELGQLAGEFNKMAEALSEQQTFLRRRAERFFNLSPDMLSTIHPSGRLLDLNPAWKSMLGYDREELKNRLLTEIVHPDDLAMTRTAFQRVITEGSGRFENRCRHQEGYYLWLAWVIVVSREDQLLYAAARDITERRQAEEKLKRQTDELERSNRELEEFAYVASHDLQEPLHLVASNVDLLTRRYQDQLDDDGLEFLGFVTEGTNRLKSLITDLLAFTRVGTHGKVFVPVNMEEVLGRVLKIMESSIKDCNAVVTHDPLPKILGDADQMVQLLQNLVENSIRFRGKAPPRIHMGVRQLSERWLFFVRDNGIGIYPEYTERVFLIFQRLHSRDDYPGTGIGLAICRKIVERHGGRIWVDSEPGKGATFYFTLQPVETQPPETRQTKPEARPHKETIADRATDLI